MRCGLVADDAVVDRDDARCKMTGMTVTLQPVAHVASWRGLVMASHAIVLAMADEATLAVDTGAHSVAGGAPVVVMVPGRPRGMAVDAVVLPVTGETGRSGLSRLVPLDLRLDTVRVHPIPLVGSRLRKGDPIVAPAERRQQDQRSEDRSAPQQETSHVSVPPRSHTATPPS